MKRIRGLAEETIFAPSSGNQKAGVCVIRVSGAGCRKVLDGLVGEPVRARQACLRTLSNTENGEPIDRCLVLWFPGPSSFTGEDVIELHVHGGRAVIDATLRTLGNFSGFRLAEPGEFARRAFLNGKLDLSEVEGLADLINAQTEMQRKLALREADGRVKALYEGWRGRLLHCLSFVEADVDFVDEDDVPDDLGSTISGSLAELLEDVNKHCANPMQGEVLRQGFRVVLAGVPNVGKSSLLNRIAQREAAIVTETAGTTRDVVEVFVDLGGYPVVFCDTAGLRGTEDPVERIGVERAVKAVNEADCVVWMCDERLEWPEAARSLTDSDAIWIRNKGDLGDPGESAPQRSPVSLVVSAQSGEGVVDLLALIQASASERFELTEDIGVVRQRHAECVTNCAGHLEAALKLSGQDHFDTELLAEELRLAARALAKIGGRIDVEDILDRIFGEFCIGK
ncbi:MAG: tRNA uridine-5-carboxymethylaminomethyl(34) synthesis GTPase MnmE [Rhizobiales bacterium]|nr:tRNA uridine-5-carboxymethylaminomethyl(34) synthesis GTPase MnmE [Hyphomicrobiales bacterium]